MAGPETFQPRYKMKGGHPLPKAFGKAPAETISVILSPILAPGHDDVVTDVGEKLIVKGDFPLADSLFRQHNPEHLRDFVEKILRQGLFVGPTGPVELRRSESGRVGNDQTALQQLTRYLDHNLANQLADLGARSSASTASRP